MEHDRLEQECMKLDPVFEQAMAEEGVDKMNFYHKNIRAGKPDKIIWGPGNWIFLDIGFSKKSPSCGLLLGSEEPEVYKYGCATKKIINYLKKHQEPTNLVIEAPLSVSFDKYGNPTGRKPEKQNGKTRYWYVGAGCVVMVAALYLIKAIADSKPPAEVRLFEGFVSFKNKKGDSGKNKRRNSNHKEDVQLLRDAVENSKPKSTIKSESIIITKTEDLINEGDKILSVLNSFNFCFMDYEIPPIIKVSKK